MKNKDIASAIIGGSFFAIPYLGLSITLVPSLAIGVMAYAASELVLSGVKGEVTLKEKNRTLYEKVTLAKKQNKEIKALIPKVELVETRKNLSRIHETVNKIIETTEKNPDKGRRLNNLFDYYLPILIKIVDKYDEVENKRLNSKDGKEFMKKADKTIADTANAFDTILANLYQKDIMDTDADMKVYELMLKADGIAGDNIMTKGSESNEK